MKKPGENLISVIIGAFLGIFTLYGLVLLYLTYLYLF